VRCLRLLRILSLILGLILGLRIGDEIIPGTRTKSPPSILQSKIAGVALVVLRHAHQYGEVTYAAGLHGRHWRLGDARRAELHRRLLR